MQNEQCSDASDLQDRTAVEWERCSPELPALRRLDWLPEQQGHCERLASWERQPLREAGPQGLGGQLQGLYSAGVTAPAAGSGAD